MNKMVNKHDIYRALFALFHFLIIFLYNICVLNVKFLSMKKVSLLLAFLGFIGMQVVFAQTREITGAVTSAEDGSSIPGASVFVKGTTLGTVTGNDGKFSMKIPQSAKTLTVSFIGMTTVDVPITSQTNYLIKMKVAPVEISEVVVTALGQTTNKAKVGYSTQTFNKDAVSKDGAVTLMDALQGKVAGANISTLGGPGSSTKVVLRGYGIIGGGNNQPLYVIDGVPLNDQVLDNSFSGNLGGYTDFGNAMTNVNPNDIESITILKGTAASSLYGSSAKNGAIMITTKRGEAGKLKIEYNGSMNWSTVGKLPDLQDAYGQGWNGTFILSENGSWGPKLDGRIRPWGATVDNSQLIKPFSYVKDNLRNFYNTGTEANNSIALSGGSDKSKFYFSYSNVSSNGVIPTRADYLQRNTFALRTNSDFGKFSINTSFNYINRKQNSPVSGQGGADAATVFESLLQIPVDIPITDFRHINNKFFNVDNYFTPYAINPYYPLVENSASQNTDRIFGDFDFKYKFTNSFNAQFRLGGDFSNSRTFAYAQPNAPTPGSWNAGNNVEGNSRQLYVGSVLQSSDYFGTINGDFMLNYSKKLNPDLNLDATAGLNYYESEVKNENAYITNLTIPGYFNLSNSTAPPTAYDYKSLRRRIGLYGQASLSYKDQLFATGNIRNDWSSTLPINDNGIFYYGLNGSWVATQTLDLSNTPISYLKVRAGYGQTGSDPNPYMTYPALGRGDIYLGYGNLTTPFNGTPAFGISNVIGNSSLKPIQTNEFEVGTEIRILQDRIGVDFTFYDRITKGQIFTVPIAPSTGYAQPSPIQTTAGMVENIGQVSNKGIELTLDAKPIKTKNFTWSLTYTYSRNINNVDKLPTQLPVTLLNQFYDAESRAVIGKAVGEIYAFVPKLSPDGKIIVNAAGEPQAAEEKGDFGNSQFKYMMGLNNVFTYKNWQLSSSLDFRYGGVFYSGTADLLLFTGNTKPTLYNNRKPFIVPNSVQEVAGSNGTITYVENKTPIDDANFGNYFYPTSNPGTSYYDRIIDRSFLKMRDITLSYKLPNKWISVIKANQATVGVYGRNLLLWTPNSNIYVDPEGTNLGNDLAGELGEFRAAPTSKSFGVMLKLTF
jgi:TonB-linked SusC/RagA family outer membrane protein